MEAFQQRVVEEKEHLDHKIEMLAKFTGGSIFTTLPEDEQSRMTAQLQHMNAYSEILEQRIAAFK